MAAAGTVLFLYGNLRLEKKVNVSVILWFRYGLSFTPVARLFAFLGGMPYPGWNEWKVVYELKVNKYRMSQPEHVSDEL